LREWFETGTLEPQALVKIKDFLAELIFEDGLREKWWL
jgi:hypothetical protein